MLNNNIEFIIISNGATIKFLYQYLRYQQTTAAIALPSCTPLSNTIKEPVTSAVHINSLRNFLVFWTLFLFEFVVRFKQFQAIC